MKIDTSSIKKIDNEYHVTLIPNRIERLFKIQPKVRRFRITGNVYIFGDKTNVYIESTGIKTKNGESVAVAIDIWRNKF